MTCLCWNVRSLNNKTDLIMDYVVNNNIMQFFVTETWITDMNNHTTASIKSYGYLIHHCFRSNSAGGGVAIIYKANMKIIKVFIKHPRSFESISVKLKCSDNGVMFCSCIYHTGNLGNFIDDFDHYLGDVFLRYERILICGDINIHLDEDLPQSKAFIDMISSYGLYQLVTDPTHKDGHLLDVVIASHQVVVDNSVTVDSNSQKSFPTCDHFPLSFHLEYGASSSNDKKEIKFRNIKTINHVEFCADLNNALDSSIFDNKEQTFQKGIENYNQACKNVLDKHAPEYSKMILENPTAPWFDSEYKNLRRERRKAEKKAKKPNASLDDYNKFLLLRQQCNELTKQKKKLFFQSQFVKHSYSQKSLYQFVDTFLDHSTAITLPPNSDSLQDIVNKFNEFFTLKIENIRKEFPQTSSCHNSIAITNSSSDFKTLTDFDLTTIDEIKEIIQDSDIITSGNDPLPASVIKDQIDTLLPIICEIVNNSLSSGSMEGAKLAHLTPLIKGKSLDSSDFKNYRPISNLSFIGKLIERVVLRRLNKHMTENNLNINHQSGYKKNHSTETLLIRITNDLLIASDSNKATVVMLLDLSAAFDTVDHNKLLAILKNEIGLDGNVLKWFTSFLCGRCQKVRVGDCESHEIIIKFGVPQGSVLGPVLFNIYIRSLYNSVTALNFCVHGFADDHQIYKSFHLQQEHNIMVNELPACFNAINKWMGEHYLKLNPGKTEIIVFGSKKVLSKLKINGAFISPSICVRFASTVKNLGFYLDSTLSFRDQIMTLKSKCFHKLRNLAKMKTFLNQHQMQTLIQALVVSALDYCNALYFGIDSHLLNQLQKIQNRACRVIFGLKKKESTSDCLKSLHWLKVSERIEFKILILVYKCLNGLAPQYLSDLIQYNTISGSRTPSLFCIIPKTLKGSRAFQNAAASLWNSLPYDICKSQTISIFKTRLKTHLFTRSYCSI